MVHTLGRGGSAEWTARGGAGGHDGDLRWILPAGRHGDVHEAAADVRRVRARHDDGSCALGRGGRRSGAAGARCVAGSRNGRGGARRAGSQAFGDDHRIEIAWTYPP